MTIRKIKFLVLLTLLLTAPSAWAETIDCTAITALPTVITVQGIYCFTGDLATSMTSGNAIEIQTNNVTIDMNGWKLGGLAAGDGTQTNGIYAVLRKNITIRNGIIRGFYKGIYLRGNFPSYSTSQGHLIEDIRAEQNTLVGIDVQGRGSIVRRNQVVDTGGSTVNSYAIGMQLVGPGVRAINNDISATTATSSSDANGLSLLYAHGAVAQNNRIANVNSANGDAVGLNIYSSLGVGVEGNHIAIVTSSSGYSLGILLNSSDSVTVEDNRLKNVYNSTVQGSTSIYFKNSFNALAGGNRIITTWFGIRYDNSTGKYMDNLTTNAGVPFTGGTAVGTNN